jgi:hypothetical protein
MSIPEGFTRQQLGLPEEDNRRTVERPSSGIWHALTDKGPATVFESVVTCSTTIYLDGYFIDSQRQLESRIGSLGFTEAPDEAIDALRAAGYGIEDMRKPA